MDIYEDFKIDDEDTKSFVIEEIPGDDISNISVDLEENSHAFDLEKLKKTIKDVHYLDCDGTLWFVSCSDLDGLKKLKNPIQESFYEYSTSGGPHRNINRNWYFTLFSFTFFKYHRKRYHKEEKVTLYLNSVPIEFTNFKDERFSNCICFNKQM